MTRARRALCALALTLAATACGLPDAPQPAREPAPAVEPDVPDCDVDDVIEGDVEDCGAWVAPPSASPSPSARATRNPSPRPTARATSAPKRTSQPAPARTQTARPAPRRTS